MLNVFDRLEIVIVRSRIPGSVAIGMCSPEKMMYSYGSSVITMRSFSMHTLAIASSSLRENTCPVGLCGELSTSARARRDRGAQRGFVEGPVRLGQRHEHRLRLTQNCIGPI